MTLEQLQKHPSFPFSNFETNDLEFLLLEMFWTELFRSCLNSPDEARDWEPLYPAARDGSPVLVLANASRGRALQVSLRVNETQSPLYPAGMDPEQPTDTFLPFDLWLGTIFEPTGVTGYPGLFISTDMSASALGLAKQTIQLLCRSDDLGVSIQGWIDKYYKTLKESGYHWR